MERKAIDWLHMALNAEQPSIYFEKEKNNEFLKENFPELVALIDVPQNPQFHPEGDVWIHTMMVLDQGAKLKSKAQYPFYYMVSALVHDYGKATKTTIDETGRIRSIGHEFELQLIKKALVRMTVDEKMNEYVLNMVKLHMRPNALFYLGGKEKAYRKLFSEALFPEDLLLLAKADHLGRKDCSSYEEIETCLWANWNRIKE
ncbi:MAG: hypothetical protein Q4C49_03340 [Bacillota bacterium]|nr:hypothetical protein [Bacillota bacterium]